MRGDAPFAAVLFNTSIRRRTPMAATLPRIRAVADRVHTAVEAEKALFLDPPRPPT
jgi:hypothetical protein